MTEYGKGDSRLPARRTQNAAPDFGGTLRSTTTVRMPWSMNSDRARRASFGSLLRWQM